LFDGYSTTVKKIMDNTDKAAKAMLGASKKNDQFNESLKRTETVANTASGGITKLIGAIGGLAAVKKVMDFTDTYASTNARLAMITNNMEEQKALQQDIFAAAGRSRGQYDAMANAAAKLSMLAGDSFTSNQEAVAFAELLTKSLKVSGASQGEQDSAFLQLTQAMTAGKLQGDEFRSIMENAPMVADAIAAYMGKSKSELKELSSQGLITADIIKGAMFNAADDINGKFAKMPVTFADIWIRIKNAGTQAFAGVSEKISSIINSQSAQILLNTLVAGLDWAAGGVDRLLDAFIRGDPIVRAFFIAGISLAGIWAGKMLWAAGASMAAYWPLILIAGTLGLIVIGLNAVGVTSADIFGFLGGLLGAFYATAYNTVSNLWNTLVSFAEFFANFLTDPVAATINLFVNMGVTILDVLGDVAQAIDNVFGSNLYSAVSGFKNQLQGYGDSFKKSNYISLSDMRMDYKSTLNTAAAWGNKGSSLGDFFDNWNFSIPAADTDGGMGFDYGQFATGGNPATVKGIGKGGAVKVENEEDIEWMRRLAERDYVARIATNTLAPNIRVEFSGPITKEADVDGVAAHMAEQLKEIIATAPEGVY